MKEPKTKVKKEKKNKLNTFPIHVSGNKKEFLSVFCDLIHNINFKCRGAVGQWGFVERDETLFSVKTERLRDGQESFRGDDH